MLLWAIVLLSLCGLAALNVLGVGSRRLETNKLMLPSQAAKCALIKLRYLPARGDLQDSLFRLRRLDLHVYAASFSKLGPSLGL